MTRLHPRLATAVITLATSTGAIHAQATAPRVTVEYQQPIANANFPELLYLFTTPAMEQPARYQHEIQRIAHDSYFDFPFLTEREGARFLDSPEGHTAVAGIVQAGHAAGLRIGASLSLSGIDSFRTVPLADAQAIVSEAEATLSPSGSAELAPYDKIRMAEPVKTELLRAYVFRKTGDGEYDPATLEDVTSRATAQSTAPDHITIKLDLGPRYAGYTGYAMSSTTYNALDLFSDGYTRWVQEAVDQFRDVPLDGTALDEFGYTRVPIGATIPFRGHFAGQGYATAFKKATGMSLTQTIFETRYAPAGHPEIRIRAIDQYWDFHRKGPQRIEQLFFDDSRKAFGPKTFAGIHDTFHNHLTNDEAWATGIDWWTIPRQFGQSDESLLLPLRMGLLVAHPGNIMYDQYYGHEIHPFAVKALNDARFDARQHYHGYNDTGRWGVDLSTQPALDVINPVEAKMRLLNQFDPAAPELPLLVVFGMPALLNWYPNQGARNVYDINGSLHIEEKVQALWDAGYRLAVLPSDLIDNGALTLDAQNRPVIHGHTFRALVYLYPEYAKPSTLAFLDAYTRRGGPLMLEGTATRDFNGTPIADAFNKIAARARVAGFSTEGMDQLGIAKDPLRAIGGKLEDGSVILTDLPSLETGTPAKFSIVVSGHLFSGTYTGVFALKAAPDGRIEKLACGQCKTLFRDNRPILELSTPADLVLKSAGPDAYQAILSGHEGENAIQLRR